MKVNLKFVVISSLVFLPNLLVNAEEDKISSQNMIDNNCGIIAVNVPPPKGSGLHGVKFRQIDGLNISSKFGSKKVTEGVRHLKFSLGNIYNEAIYSGGTNELEINIKPNTKYFVAAKRTQKKSNRSITNDEWIPYIWQTKPIECI
jgi:hypothetical protein